MKLGNTLNLVTLTYFYCLAYREEVGGRIWNPLS
jgi:hypothetical protein